MWSGMRPGQPAGNPYHLKHGELHFASLNCLYVGHDQFVYFAPGTQEGKTFSAKEIAAMLV